ncbi:5-demethoxyubiquinol-8 5-hydroxylase UbiM [Asaia krungthepensis]|uniref:Monooxygenase n=1 Tax=Asaia krungthepensis NRIC 0535 TaxID=1307925 RepID=A0ABQ0PWZ3_9PROT|nr:5-demethoxyubiquinol-8 5-hydroxylase UbiM [Asaia krungthepensis]GBQ83690.1 monooxygenase [Asaia krungthepensis NRIC 0535]
MSSQPDIVVAGAGPAGLACALSLAEKGWRVTVTDPAPEHVLAAPAFDGREIALTHHSRDWLEAHGIWSRIAATSVSPLKTARIETGQDAAESGAGALLFRAPEGSSDALGYLVPNHLIRTALYEAARQEPRITFLSGRKVVTSSGNRDVARTLLDDGTLLESALLVAADGRFSRIRQSRGIGAIIHDFGKQIMVCRMRHPEPHHGVALQWFDEGQTIALLPVADDDKPGHLSSLVLTLDPGDIATLKALPPDVFSEDITRRTQSRLGVMVLESDRVTYPLKTVFAHRFQTTRLALIGDAAVGMHPITAHGFNLGLKGQAILCEEIAQGDADPGSAIALRSFERRHRRATAPLFAATNGIATVYTHDARPTLALRKAGLAVANRLSPLKSIVTGFLMDRGHTA